MRILITGGTGSIGHEVTRQALLKGWHPIIFSRDESMQADMKREYPDCDYVIGDVEVLADLRYVRSLEPDYVVHCAAMKHVPICEQQPLKAVQTNVIGTMNVLLTFADFAKGTVIISTDKTVEPTSVMGFTKKLGEAMARDSMFANNRVMITRFGNIIPSRGSVIPIWLDAKKKGLPLKITDPEMTRYFVPIQDAVTMVWAALDDGRSGDIFMPELARVRMGDLLDVIADGAETEVIGPRPGEKKDELIMSAEEAKSARTQHYHGIHYWLLRKGSAGRGYLETNYNEPRENIIRMLDRALGDTWHD